MPLLLVVATVVQFWAGQDIYRQAWVNLRHRTTSMDTLVALGTGVAYGYGAFVVLWPGPRRAVGAAAAPLLRERADRRRADPDGPLAGAEGEEAHRLLAARAGRPGAGDRAGAPRRCRGRRTSRRRRRRRPGAGAAGGEAAGRRRRHRRPLGRRRVDADRRERAGREDRRRHGHRRHGQHHRHPRRPHHRGRRRQHARPDRPPGRGRPGLGAADAAARRPGLRVVRAGRAGGRAGDLPRLAGLRARTASA